MISFTLLKRAREFDQDQKTAESAEILREVEFETRRLVVWMRCVIGFAVLFLIAAVIHGIDK